MPFVNIKTMKGALTEAQKTELHSRAYKREKMIAACNMHL
jgi:hypothetical protein